VIEFKIIYQDEDGNDLFTRSLYFPDMEHAHEHANKTIEKPNSKASQYEILELG
jgi:hypothetical protein